MAFLIDRRKQASGTSRKKRARSCWTNIKKSPKSGSINLGAGAIRAGKHHISHIRRCKNTTKNVFCNGIDVFYGNQDIIKKTLYLCSVNPTEAP